MSAFDQTGYNEADRQFHEKDLQLIAKIRETLDATRSKTESERARDSHWMRCPKCGAQMKEIQQEKVLIDQCTGCGGIFFDAGEFAMLLGHHRPSSRMLDDLFAWLPKWTANRDAFITPKE